MGIFHFGHSGVGGTVRIYYTVAEEISVAGRIRTIIATVFKVNPSIFVNCFHTLIHPIPNISPLQVGIFIDGLPLQIQVSARIPHCVRVFRRDNWAVAPFLTHFFQPCSTWILRNKHIGVVFPKPALVVYGAVHKTAFLIFQVLIGVKEVNSVSGFVPK
ncbi:hypothetical protein SDC9_63313 [bioreactor metagenome]|uniref:Uncharacterized protein n=1 Tax=bioreactor metagenome TaxID=1076179 RepID=A0A644XM98_9ZZZZ